MKEDWTIIEEFSNYSISNLGRVKNNSTGKTLKGRDNGNGYLSVILYRGNSKQYSRYIHRLVGEAFLNTGNTNLVIDHIDFNRSNNAVTNLRYVTQKENVHRSLSKWWEITHPCGKITIEKNLNRFARDNNLTVTLLHAVITGKQAHHKGFKCRRLICE